MGPQAMAGSSEITSDPIRFGVGARVTASLACTDSVSILSSITETLDTSGLVHEPSPVSTFISGPETHILRYLTDYTEAIGKTGKPALVVIHLSRGCPGSIVCELPNGPGPRSTIPPRGRKIGYQAIGEWALYPLDDGHAAQGQDQTTDGETGSADHMRDIYQAIEDIRAVGVLGDTQRYITQLKGDAGLVLQSAVHGWVAAGKSVQHVASHLTMALNQSD